eukprot:1158426-Pelagomonas_calceolata.AAC.11
MTWNKKNVPLEKYQGSMYLLQSSWRWLTHRSRFICASCYLATSWLVAGADQAILLPPFPAPVNAVSYQKNCAIRQHQSIIVACLFFPPCRDGCNQTKFLYSAASMPLAKGAVPSGSIEVLLAVAVKCPGTLRLPAPPDCTSCYVVSYQAGGAIGQHYSVVAAHQILLAYDDPLPPGSDPNGDGEEQAQ